MQRLLRLAVSVAVATWAARDSQAGTVSGNGCCYDKPAPPGTGKYCGKGGGHASGSSCDCGIYGIFSPYVGVDVLWPNTSLMGSIVVPDIGDDAFELYLWDGSEYLFESMLSPGQTYVFAGGSVDRFRILGIDPSTLIDPSVHVAFPLELNLPVGETFNGRIVGLWTVPGDFDGDCDVDSDDLDILLNAPGGLGDPYRPGDIDGDGDVDGEDLNTLLAYFGVSGACCDPPAGDVDGDLDVDLSDLAALLAHYGLSGGAYTDGDIDGNGLVDLGDLAALLADYGSTCPFVQ